VNDTTATGGAETPNEQALVDTADERDPDATPGWWDAPERARAAMFAWEMAERYARHPRWSDLTRHEREDAASRGLARFLKKQRPRAIDPDGSVAKPMISAYIKVATNGACLDVIAERFSSLDEEAERGRDSKTNPATEREGRDDRASDDHIRAAWHQRYDQLWRALRTDPRLTRELRFIALARVSREPTIANGQAHPGPGIDWAWIVDEIGHDTAQTWRQRFKRARDSSTLAAVDGMLIADKRVQGRLEPDDEERWRLDDLLSEDIDQ
jgi:hypothetical protein